MKELVTLFLLLHNPATDEEFTLPYAQYELDVCLYNEKLMNNGAHPYAKELKKEKLELVETRCDETID